LTTEKHATRTYLGPALQEWIEQEAVRRHCSVAQVIRNLIVDRMEADALIAVTPITAPSVGAGR